jgi:hypothetical protein
MRALRVCAIQMPKRQGITDCTFRGAEFLSNFRFRPHKGCFCAHVQRCFLGRGPG